VLAWVRNENKKKIEGWKRRKKKRIMAVATRNKHRNTGHGPIFTPLY
jgi:hypothetical protein